MARLIEIQPTVEQVPSDLTLTVGDVLRFDTSGGAVAAGDSVALLGIFTSGVVGTDGQVMIPSGTPNVVMFQARSPGRTEIDVAVGGPYSGSDLRRLVVTVEGATSR